RRGTLGRRFRREAGAQQGGLIDHLAPGAELHRPIRIAFARRKRIAEGHDEEVLDHHFRFGELAPIGQFDRHRDAGLGTIERVRHARDGELVGAGDALALGFASGLARLPAPRALAVYAAELLGRDPDRDRVRVGQNVVFSRRAPGISALAARRIAAGTAVALIAGLAHRLSRPAEAALLIALAGGRRATVGGRSILAVGIVERPFGAPDDVRRERLRWIAAHRVERSLVQRESARRLERIETGFRPPRSDRRLDLYWRQGRRIKLRPKRSRACRRMHPSPTPSAAIITRRRSRRRANITKRQPVADDPL